ncbi:hypothetical protein [Trichlorobacter lovleyi]|nr:hypothetical protein [Trichlorobacter lovleyi]
MKQILVTLLLLAIAAFCPHQAEAVQPKAHQLLYPSSKRVVIFVADG